MDQALLNAILLRRNREPNMSRAPVAGSPQDMNAGMGAGVADAFNRIRELAGKATDYGPVGAIASKNYARAMEDQAAGAQLSMLGGKHLAPYGKQLVESALERSKPFRPNAADTAYQDPTTGEMVENPHMADARPLKAAEFELQRRIEEEKARLGRDLTEREKAFQRASLEAMAAQRNTTNITIGAGHDTASIEKAKLSGNHQGLPTAIAEKIGAVRAEMRAVNTAIALAEKNPNAFGVQQGAPGEVLAVLGQTYSNRKRTPAERRARSAVFEEVSGVIKARAGTAQSKNEERTLMRFLPNAWDDAPTIKDLFTQYNAKLKEIEAGHLEAGQLTGKVAPAAPAEVDHAAGAAAEIARRNAQRKGMSHGG